MPECGFFWFSNNWVVDYMGLPVNSAGLAADQKILDSRITEWSRTFRTSLCFNHSRTLLMTLQTFRPSVLTTRPDNGSPVANYMSELSQEQYAIVVETACSWLRSMETLCQTRQQAAHQALNACEGVAKKLHTAGAHANLMEIHTDLMNFYMESPINYCQQLATIALQTQIEMMARFNHFFVGNSKERMEKALSNFQATLPANSGFFEKKLDRSASEARVR